MMPLESRAQDSHSLCAQVFAVLEQKILDGALEPGESLIELKLSAELGVSRTPVREAMRQLEREGLVRTIPNKGAVVVGVSEKDIEDIYTIRTSIEGLAAKWAAAHITDEELAELRGIVELQAFYAAKEDGNQVWQLDSRFHELLYDACRSRPLKQTLSAFHTYIQHARQLAFQSSGRAAAVIREHTAILEALERHDAASSERLTAGHIQNAMRNFLRNIKTHESA